MRPLTSSIHHGARASHESHERPPSAFVASRAARLTHPTHSESFGGLLRFWRNHRHLSQLALSLAADVSSRHVSFMETGRARPSVDMVARLTEVLEIPAFVLTRHWDLVTTNQSSMRVDGWLLEARRRNQNIMRSVFDPDELRSLIVNWDEVAQDMIRHLYNQVMLTPTDRRGVALLEEILASPDLPPRWNSRDFARPPAPLLTAVYHKDGRDVRLSSTLTTFGTPRDVTLEALRIECSFPADDETERWCRELAADSSSP